VLGGSAVVQCGMTDTVTHVQILLAEYYWNFLKPNNFLAHCDFYRSARPRI